MTVYKVQDNKLVTKFNKIIATIDGNRVLDHQGNAIASVEDRTIYNSNGEALATIDGNEIFDTANNRIGSVEDARRLIDDTSIDTKLLAAVWTVYFLG